MIARVATFEGVNVEEAERTLEEAEAVIRPIVEGMTGYQGRMDLLDSEGKVVSITLFGNEEDATAAEPTFDEEMPRRLGDIFKNWASRRTSVGLYRVIFDERRT